MSTSSTSISTGKPQFSFHAKTGLVTAAMAAALSTSGLLLPTNAALFGSVVGLSSEVMYRQFIAKQESSYSELFLAGLQGAVIFYVGSNFLQFDAASLPVAVTEGFLTGYVHYNNMKSLF